MLSLCIEILCNNCRTYLGATKSNARQVKDFGDSSTFQRVTRGAIHSQAVAQQTGGPRRMNTWQQQQGYY